jgi:hypothetical protein
MHSNTTTTVSDFKSEKSQQQHSPGTTIIHTSIADSSSSLSQFAQHLREQQDLKEKIVMLKQKRREKRNIKKILSYEDGTIHRN